MQAYVIIGLAVYGLTVLLLQIMKRIYRSEPQSAIQYIVYTQHSQAQIEWSIRSLAKLSKLEGREFSIYVVDSGSNDDTLKIIECFERSGIHIHKLTELPYDIQEQTKHVQVIDLREAISVAH